MAHSPPRPAPDRSSVYREVTDRILADLEAGRLPWVQPWTSDRVRAPLGLPANAATGRRYSGINILILWCAVVERGFAGQGWLTFRQAQALGGSVRRGERGTSVVYADRFTPRDERVRADRDGDAARSVPFLKRFTVFNTEQCDGLPGAARETAATVPPGLIRPEVETMIARSGADLRIGGDRAFYDIDADHVRLPPPHSFRQPIDWHRTALHELGHWTGAGHRLARDLSGRFGSAPYAQEELVAELMAAFTCASLSIVPTVRHADYIGAWLQVLRADERAVVRAASAASRAADFLLAFLPSDAPNFPASVAADPEHAERPCRAEVL